jgi:uncharacterized repeat protein (TIGR01451 family)
MAKGKYKRKAQRAQEIAKQTPERMAIVENQEAVENQAKPATKARNNPRDNKHPPRWERFKVYLGGALFTNQAIAAFTSVLAAAAIYQFIIMGGQLNVMRIDQRAWLKFEAYSNTGEAERFDTTITTGQAVTYPLRIENIGKTPATNIVVKIFVDVVDSSQEPPLDRVDGAKIGSLYPFGLIQSGIIFPNTDFKQLVVRPQKGGGPLVATDSEVSAVRNSQAYVAVYGIITYEDVFHTPTGRSFVNG